MGSNQPATGRGPPARGPTSGGPRAAPRAPGGARGPAAPRGAPTARGRGAPAPRGRGPPPPVPTVTTSAPAMSLADELAAQANKLKKVEAKPDTDRPLTLAE